MVRLAIILLCFSLAAAPAPGADPPLANYAGAADYSASLGGRALLVMRDGKVVFERYDNRWTADRAHPLASGTKSFAGPLAAAAIEDKIIPGWDARVSDAIPQWRDDPLKREITVRHLLTLSSGLDAADPAVASRGGGRLLGEAAGRRDERIGQSDVSPADDKHAAALAAKMTGRPGEQFEYGPTHFYAFAAYLEARLAETGSPHKTVEDYFTARIAKPIGLKVAYWNRDKADHVNLPGGMALTARQWAAYGEFIRLNGAVRGEDGALKPILDPALLAECFKPSASNPQYGLTWWLPNNDTSTVRADAGGGRPGAGRLAALRKENLARQTKALTGPDGKPLRAYMAAGLGKQRLLILPDQGLTIVRFAEGTRENQRDYSDAKLLEFILGPRSATRPAD